MADEKKEGKKVKGQDPVLIEYTEKAQFHKKGEKATVHSMQAEKLIKKGFAKEVKE